MPQNFLLHSWLYCFRNMYFMFVWYDTYSPLLKQNKKTLFVLIWHCITNESMYLVINLTDIVVDSGKFSLTGKILGIQDMLIQTLWLSVEKGFFSIHIRVKYAVFLQFMKYFMLCCALYDTHCTLKKVVHMLSNVSVC